MLQKVLYVDDDEALTELAELVLGAAGIEVKCCHSGAEAAQSAEAFAPDLLLLDREMPDMDGLQTLAALRAIPALADVPAIFVTAETDPARTRELRAAGAADIITKPVDPSQLAAQLRAIHARSP